MHDKHVTAGCIETWRNRGAQKKRSPGCGDRQCRSGRPPEPANRFS